MVSEQKYSSGTDPEDGSHVDRISLNSYISENSNLFLVMGVFAALSVYISSIPSDGVDEHFIQLGLVTSLIITGLLAVVIVLALSNQVSDEAEVITSLLHIKNIDTLVFLSLFATLFYSLLQVVIEDIQALAIIFIVVLFAGIFALMLSIIMHGSSKLDPYIENSELRAVIIATIVFTISLQIIRHLNEYLYDEYKLQEFQFDNDVTLTEAIPAIFYFTFSILLEILPILVVTMGFVVFFYILSEVGKRIHHIKEFVLDQRYFSQFTERYK